MFSKKFVIVLLIVIFVPLLALLAFLSYLFYVDSKMDPDSVMVTNVTDTGASIVWRTGEMTDGKLVVKEKGAGGWDLGPFYDDRDMEQNAYGDYELKEEGVKTRYTHHVTIRGLEPEKEYEYALVGSIKKISKYESGTSFETIETRAINENLKTPDPGYGQIESVEAEDSVIILTKAIDESTRASTYVASNLTYSVDLRIFGNDEIDASEMQFQIMSGKDWIVEDSYTEEGYQPFQKLTLSEASGTSQLQNRLAFQTAAQAQGNPEEGGGTPPAVGDVQILVEIWPGTNQERVTILETGAKLTGLTEKYDATTGAEAGSTGSGSSETGDGNEASPYTAQKTYRVSANFAMAYQNWSNYLEEDSTGTEDYIEFPVPGEPYNKLSTTSSNLSVLGRVSAQTEPDSLEADESGTYSIVSSEFDEPLGEFALNLDGEDKIQIRLFVDTNGNGVRDEDEEVLEEYTEITLRKESDVAVYSLQTGWNMIALPVFSSEDINTASKLIGHFNDQGAGIVHLAKYTDAGFVMYTKRADEADQEYNDDFNLIPGEGYFVLNYTRADVRLEGNKFDEEVPFRVRNGWNLVGVYTNEQKYSAEELLEDMNAQGIVADTVTKYDSGLYKNVVYVDDLLYGNDFSLYERNAYFIRVESGGGEDVRFTPSPD